MRKVLPSAFLLLALLCEPLGSQADDVPSLPEPSTVCLNEYGRIARSGSKFSIAWARLRNRISIFGNHFISNRRLLSFNGFLEEPYEFYLGKEFTETLRGLRPGQHWIDIGAGDASAIKDYLESPMFSNHARVTAVGVSIPRSASLAEIQIKAPDFRYLSGRYVENISAVEIGTADLITDVMGAIHYSLRLDQTLQHILGLLKNSGSLFTHSSPITVVLTPGGQISFLDFLMKIQGVRVYPQPWGGIRIERTGGPLVVPELRLLNVVSGRPPRRVFELVGGS